MPSFRDSPNGGAPVPVVTTNQVLERDQSQWLFTQADLLRTPSILEGMPAAQELANRQKGVNFITQVGIMLKLPQLTLATASVYLHRLFMRQKMPTEKNPGLHHYSAAATALFLATKVEENCRKMRELVVACCRVAQKQPNLVVDEQNKEYWKWRDTILHNEDVLLEALCFDLQLEQPYRILFEFLQYYGVQDNKNLRNSSWAFLNDSHVTTMCLLHSPRIIAGAALYTGVRLANITLPDDDRGRPWWEHLDLDVMEIQRACNLMFDIYANDTIPRVGAKDAYTKEDDMSFLDKTRGAFSPGSGMSPARSVRSLSQMSGTKRDREDLEGGQSDEWGAPSKTAPVEQSLRTPKRQRKDTPEVDQPPPSRIPPVAGSRIPPGANGGSRVPSRIPPAAAPGPTASIDDVQQRIDDIINASSRQNSSSSVPTLSRQPSGRESWQGDARAPQSNRSPADSGATRPPLTTTGANGSVIGRPTPHQEGVAAQQATSSIPNRRRASQEETGAVDEVDYGSEEGEV
jgi:protein BUR2